MAAVTDTHSACVVSASCYPPRRLGEWVTSRLTTLPNLRVLLRTTVRGAVRDASSGSVTGLMLVSRKFKHDPADEWAGRLSDSIGDWYSPLESPAFRKQAYLFCYSGNNIAMHCVTKSLNSPRYSPLAGTRSTRR